MMANDTSLLNPPSGLSLWQWVGDLWAAAGNAAPGLLPAPTASATLAANVTDSNVFVAGADGVQNGVQAGAEYVANSLPWANILIIGGVGLIALLVILVQVEKI